MADTEEYKIFMDNAYQMTTLTDKIAELETKDKSGVLTEEERKTLADSQEALRKVGEELKKFEEKIVHNEKDNSWLKGLVDYQRDASNAVSKEQKKAAREQVNRFIGNNKKTNNVYTEYPDGSKVPFGEMPEDEKEQDSWMSSWNAPKKEVSADHSDEEEKKEEVSTENEKSENEKSENEKSGSEKSENEKSEGEKFSSGSERTSARDAGEEEVVSPEGEEEMAMAGGEEKRSFEDYMNEWNRAYSRRTMDEKVLGDEGVNAEKSKKGGYQFLTTQTIDGEQVLVAKTRERGNHLPFKHKCKTIIHADGQVDFGKSTNKYSIHDAVEMKLRMGQSVVIQSGTEKFKDVVENELFKLAIDKGLDPEIRGRAYASLEKMLEARDKEIAAECYKEYMEADKPRRKVAVLKKIAKKYNIKGTGEDDSITDDDILRAGGPESYFKNLRGMALGRLLKDMGEKELREPEVVNVMATGGRDADDAGPDAPGGAGDAGRGDDAGSAGPGGAGDGKGPDDKGPDGPGGAGDGKGSDDKGSKKHPLDGYPTQDDLDRMLAEKDGKKPVATGSADDAKSSDDKRIDAILTEEKAKLGAEVGKMMDEDKARGGVGTGAKSFTELNQIIKKAQQENVSEAKGVLNVTQLLMQAKKNHTK